MSRNLVKPIPAPDLLPGREPVDAVIAFGANLGDREATLLGAATRIERLPLVDSLRLSPFMETVALRPDGPDPDAPGYLNAVAIITTRLAPQILLGLLHAIEDEQGRERGERWADRTLDLDLITYGDLRSEEPSMLVPHPRAAERLFVLEPWLALDAEAVLPGAGRVADLVTQLHAQEAP